MDVRGLGPGTSDRIFPLSTATFYTRPDIAYVAVSDIGPSRVCLAWDSTRRSPLIAEFAAIAEGLASKP